MAPNKATMLSDVCLSDVCMSVACIGHKSRTDRPRKTKIGTELAHVTRTPLSRSKVNVTRSLCLPPCWRVRQLQRWARECVGCGKLLLRCRLLGGARSFSAHGGGDGRGHIVAAARLQLIIIIIIFLYFIIIIVIIIIIVKI